MVQLSLWDNAFNPKCERNSSPEYIKKYLHHHYWLRASSEREAFDFLHKMAKSDKVRNIYYYPIGLRPGKPVPVAQYVMEVAVNVDDRNVSMIFWRAIKVT